MRLICIVNIRRAALFRQFDRVKIYARALMTREKKNVQLATQIMSTEWRVEDGWNLTRHLCASRLVGPTARAHTSSQLGDDRVFECQRAPPPLSPPFMSTLIIAENESGRERADARVLMQKKYEFEKRAARHKTSVVCD